LKDSRHITPPAVNFFPISKATLQLVDIAPKKYALVTSRKYIESYMAIFQKSGKITKIFLDEDGSGAAVLENALLQHGGETRQTSRIGSY
jgi:hypothetical protein